MVETIVKNTDIINTPKIGETKRAYEIGKKGWNNFIWHGCEMCGKERWVRLIKDNLESVACKQCGKIKSGFAQRGEKNCKWKGGKIYQKGYVFLALKPDDFFYPMTDDDGYVREHRLVMAKALGRCLQSWEIVHHKNGIKDDNRYPDNLELTTKGSHTIEHNKGYRDGYAKGFADGREKQIETLRQRVTMLEMQIAAIVYP